MVVASALVLCLVSRLRLAAASATAGAAQAIFPGSDKSGAGMGRRRTIPASGKLLLHTTDVATAIGDELSDAEWNRLPRRLVDHERLSGNLRNFMRGYSSAALRRC